MISPLTFLLIKFPIIKAVEHLFATRTAFTWKTIDSKIFKTLGTFAISATSFVV